MSGTRSVIVVGGGPVGLTTALMLGRAGTRVTLFEQGDILHQEPRATTIHAATLDQLDELGVYSRIEPLGIICPTMRYWDRATGELIAEFDHAVLAAETSHPWVLQCEQNKLSRVLFEMTAAFPSIEVHNGAKVVACAQTADRVDVRARLSNGTEQAYSAEYLVGADGARSTVREQFGIPFRRSGWAAYCSQAMPPTSITRWEQWA